MEKDIPLYRVRKSFNDIKSQKGAFLLLEAAVITARKFGMNVYDSSGNLIYGSKPL